MSVCGVGIYVPYSGYVCRRNKAVTKEYTVWADMFTRCYTGCYPTYINCYVNKEWHRSDKFWMWAEQQVGFLQDGYYLDKGILILGNKEYGPKSCAFVPRDLNQFLCGADAIRGIWPRGICYDKARDKFCAKISIDNKTVNLGRFVTLDSAKMAYETAKTEEGRRWAVRLKTEDYTVDSRIITTMENYTFRYEDDL